MTLDPMAEPEEDKPPQVGPVGPLRACALRMRKIDSSRQQSNNPTLASIALLSTCHALAARFAQRC